MALSISCGMGVFVLVAALLYRDVEGVIKSLLAIASVSLCWSFIKP